MPKRDDDIHVLTLWTTADVAARAFVTALRAHGVTLEWRAFLLDPHTDPHRVASLSWDGSLVALVALVVSPTAPPGVGAALVAALYPGLPLDVPATLRLTAAGTSISMTTQTAPELMEALVSIADRLTTIARPARFADRERHATYVHGRWFSE